jgi:hypothetical protein
MRVFSVAKVEVKVGVCMRRCKGNDNINHDMDSLSLRRCHLRKSGDFIKARGVVTLIKTFHFPELYSKNH